MRLPLAINYSANTNIILLVHFAKCSASCSHLIKYAIYFDDARELLQIEKKHRIDQKLYNKEED